jgi:NRAMP (natural resistance-associated macrophage protein)-like metal ion transporter
LSGTRVPGAEERASRRTGKSAAMIQQLTRSVTEHPAVKHLGPGLITGAADDDPSGIATYSQAGALFGFNMLWPMLITFPLMTTMQMISARLGCLTGRGLAANIKATFPPWVLYGVVALLLIANTINIAADIAAMGEAMHLIVGGSPHIYSIGFGVLCLALQVFLSYQTYVRYLKWLTLTLLSYVAVVFTVNVEWLSVLRGMFAPQLDFDSDTITIIVAVLGTTISPYLFFWQAAQEMEDLRSDGIGAKPTGDDARRHLTRIRWDSVIGMGFANLVAFFIVLSAAATLHTAGITRIETSAQAAEALRPLAGHFAFLLFSCGIIGTGLLAVPVLAGSAAYAVTETMEWRSGLDKKLHEAKEFYAIVAIATLGGVLLNFTPVDPIKALLWSAVVNCVIAVPIMVVMMLLGARPAIMGHFVIGKRLRVMGWLATTLMALAVVAMFWTM